SSCCSSSFFFLVISRQPRSTLFPYTTLFRSIDRGKRDEGDQHRDVETGGEAAAEQPEPDHFVHIRASRAGCSAAASPPVSTSRRSEEHTSELQSPCNLVCRLLLEKKKKKSTS